MRDALIAESTPYIQSTPSDAEFGAMGIRTENLYNWLFKAEQLRPHLTSKENTELQFQLEYATVNTFPFLKKDGELLPFSRLRNHILPGSRGIVIAAGHSHFRYLCHLLLNLRTVLKSQLPIQIVYAGDEDLPAKYRDVLTSLFPYVETLDIFSVFNDEGLDLVHGTWAIKPFALLASKFEHVIGIDADAVFLQQPEILLNQQAFTSRGALLFHDRLLWQNVFKDRAIWWHKQMDEAGRRTPSDTLQHSKVWMEGYAEEGDSGVVALDKSRLPVFMGLLNIAWQNTKTVREKWTYKQTYGDKESWWFGFELSGVPFAFEKHYGSIMGDVDESGKLVCSFSIAHLDEKDKLLWYNGSLLKNKAINLTEFLIPKSWMTDGEWLKGASKQDKSCMRGSDVRSIDPEMVEVISRSVDEAKKFDKTLVDLGFDLKLTTEMRGG
jgi:alpha 1,3-mannosyltransferase